MSGGAGPEVLERVLAVSRQLGASADLSQTLRAVIDALRDTLDAERATVFEYDAERDELFTTVAHGLATGGAGGDTGGPGGAAPIRLGTGRGLAGECARQRRLINVADAYADPRFDPRFDRRSGFRTRSVLTVPLVDHDGELVGVSQVLNKRGGPFTAADETLAAALGAQAAVALRRGRLIEDRMVRQKLERDLELARRIQQSSFPRRMPAVRGFDLEAWSRPAEETGGDAYDVMPVPYGARTGAGADGGPVEAEGAALLLADAAGHGVGPALAVTQLCSMLRMASHLGADLAVAAAHVNRQLCADLPEGRFITAWLGLIRSGPRPALTTLSAGQAPLLLYRRADDRVESFGPDTPPLGVIEETVFKARTLPMDPGDVLAVLSDGIFEAMDRHRDRFGAERIAALIRDHRDAPARQIIATLRDAVDRHTGGAPPEDDRTAIVVKTNVETSTSSYA